MVHSSPARAVRLFGAALSLLIVLGAAVPGWAASAGPRHSATTAEPVKDLKDGRQLLAPALQRTIAQNFPGFHPVADCASGDFDGDGLEDAVLYLSDRHRGVPNRQCHFLLVAFNQTPSGAFRPHLLARRPDPSTVYDRELHRRRRFDDYAFTIGTGVWTVEDASHHTRQVDFRPNTLIVETDGKTWFWRGGRYHWVWDVGDDTSE